MESDMSMSTAEKGVVGWLVGLGRLCSCTASRFDLVVDLI
jgi:hypothetical protein